MTAMLSRFAFVSLALGCGVPPQQDVIQTAAPTTQAPARDAEPSEDPNKTRMAAATRALAEGRKAFDEGDMSKAMMSAQLGLGALGKDYAGPAVEDDTEMKLEAAKERVEQPGGARDAVTIVLRMLELRIDMAHKHWKLGP